ncbi:MAG TPA: response regulator, partial [Prolixibacteraceae bacterium]|nr:response regulator [Prolixibacteraceae bacterium]
HTNELHFFVKDTGIGISEEKKAQVFDSFIQEDNAITRKYEGNGLGLTIAKGLVELLNGKIWMSSEKGLGSIFYFSIPYLINETDPSAQKANVKLANEFTTILIAEDNENNFVLLKTILNKTNIKIIHAENGLQAIELSKQHPETNLILMDLKMPEVDGFEATRQIRLFRADLPIVALTAYSNNEDKELAMESGCNDFLTKPVSKEVLLKKLREYVTF